MKKLAAIVLSALLAVAGMISASAVSTLADATAETQSEVVTAEESATGTSGMVQDDGNTSIV